MKSDVPIKPKSTSRHFKEFTSSPVKDNKDNEVYLYLTPFILRLNNFTLIQVSLKLEAKRSLRTKKGGSTPQRKSKNIKVMN